MSCYFPESVCTGVYWSAILFLLLFTLDNIIIMDIKFFVMLCTCIAIIHQFDTMIYPERVKSSRTSGWGLFALTHMKVSPPFKMRKLCMNVYLEPYKRMLLSGKFEFQEDFDISNVVINIDHLFMCCSNQYCGTSDTDVHCWSLLTALKEVSIVTFVVKHVHVWKFILLDVHR